MSISVWDSANEYTIYFPFREHGQPSPPTGAVDRAQVKNTYIKELFLSKTLVFLVAHIVNNLPAM